jgi:hypothetical protein
MLGVAAKLERRRIAKRTSGEASRSALRKFKLHEGYIEKRCKFA